MTALLLLVALGGQASAGTLIIETTVAAEVRHDGLRIAQTYGAGEVSVPDLPAGPATLDVYRNGRRTPLVLDIAEEGLTRLRIGEDSIDGAETPAGKAPQAEGPAPRLELRAATGQRFLLMVDGEVMGTFDGEHPLVVEGLGPGVHAIQLRNPERTVVWVRGQLELRPGDELLIRAKEGRMIEVFGRPEAWSPNL